MRRMTACDGGAVAVMTAVLSLVLFGLAALVVDAGAFYAERRQLQNGADAAALAVAADCADGVCVATTASATSQAYADDNAGDDRSQVDLLCGSAPLTPCATPPPGPAGRGYVHVRTLTRDRAGGDEVPWVFGQLLADGDGTTVSADATVIWGPPGGLESALPVTMSACEWERFTAGGTALAPPPEYSEQLPLGYSRPWLSTAGRAFERIFYTHDTSSAPRDVETTCPATPPGGDAAGSFGWLSDTDASCSVTTTTSDTGELGHENQPGNTVPAVCKRGEFPQPGETVYIPVYDEFLVGGDAAGRGGGQRVWYHLHGYAAFYVTGYNLQLGGGADRRSIVTGSYPCDGQKRCFSGFFTRGLAPTTGTVGSGPSYGATITQLVD